MTFSQITKLPYVECDPETFDDQVYMFTEEEAAKEFAKSYVEKNTPLLTVKVLRKQMPNFYMGLYAEGVNMVIFHEGDQTRRIELEQIFPKPDMEKMNKQHLPVRTRAYSSPSYTFCRNSENQTREETMPSACSTCVNSKKKCLST